MMLKQWITENIPDFNLLAASEEDMKVKVLLPYLRTLGYSDQELGFEKGIDVQIGTKKTRVYSDIVVKIDGKVEMVIDAKRPRRSLAEKDLLQVISYAKLIVRSSM